MTRRAALLNGGVLAACAAGLIALPFFLRPYGIYILTL